MSERDLDAEEAQRYPVRVREHSPAANALRTAPTQRKAPAIAPVYDEVWAAGVAWVESLADDDVGRELEDALDRAGLEYFVSRSHLHPATNRRGSLDWR